MVRNAKDQVTKERSGLLGFSQARLNLLLFGPEKPAIQLLRSALMSSSTTSIRTQP